MSLSWLPNALTIARCALGLIAGWIIWLYIAQQSVTQDGRWIPLVFFVVVALTDFFDGFAARKLNAVSTFGAFLDPVADKILVASSLIGLCAVTGGWTSWFVAPSLVIIARDTAVTLLRLKPGIILPVTPLAKWKTATEMVGIGLALLSFALPESFTGVSAQVGIAFIAIAACLSAYTGYLYWRSLRG